VKLVFPSGCESLSTKDDGWWWWRQWRRRRRRSEPEELVGPALEDN